MRINLEQLDDAYSFEATNEAGNAVRIEASPALGGTGQGARPMELVAMGLGGCSSIDILSILEKQRQSPDHLEVRLEAERRKDEVPAVFTAIHLHYVLKGHQLAASKVRRAIELSLDKYCSVASMLNSTATITYSFAVNGEEYAGS